MARYPMAIAATAIALLVLAIGARQALTFITYQQFQRALDQAGPRIASARTGVVQAVTQADFSRPHTQIAGEDALAAAQALQGVIEPSRVPGWLGAQIEDLRQSLGSLEESLARLGRDARNEAPRSVVAMRAAAMAAAVEGVDSESLRRHGLSPAEMRAEVNKAWLRAWSLDLDQVDADVIADTDTWLAWQRDELPSLIHEDRWQSLEEKTALNVKVIVDVRNRLEGLAPPLEAQPIAAEYLQALAALEAAHESIKEYVQARASVPRGLLRSGEALAKYDATRRSALGALDNLLASRGQPR